MTREKLLDAAERLFARHGFEGASMRAITSEAEANLAAVNYHFGSKEDLFLAVFRRRVEPLNAERLRLLDAAEADAGEGGPPLDAILEAFLAPPLAFAGCDQNRQFLRIAGRMLVDPHERLETVLAEFDEVRRRFITAVKRALPHLSDEDLMWRLHFAIGVLGHTLANLERLDQLTLGACSGADGNVLLAQMRGFLVGGFSNEQGTSVVTDDEESR